VRMAAIMSGGACAVGALQVRRYSSDDDNLGEDNQMLQNQVGARRQRNDYELESLYDSNNHRRPRPDQPDTVGMQQTNFDKHKKPPSRLNTERVPLTIASAGHTQAQFDEFLRTTRHGQNDEFAAALMFKNPEVLTSKWTEFTFPDNTPAQVNSLVAAACMSCTPMMIDRIVDAGVAVDYQSVKWLTSGGDHEELMNMFRHLIPSKEMAEAMHEGAELLLEYGNDAYDGPASEVRMWRAFQQIHADLCQQEISSMPEWNNFRRGVEIAEDEANEASSYGDEASSSNDEDEDLRG